MFIHYTSDPLPNLTLTELTTIYKKWTRKNTLSVSEQYQKPLSGASKQVKVLQATQEKENTRVIGNGVEAATNGM